MNTVAFALTGLCTAWTLLGTLSVIRATRGQRLPESLASRIEDPFSTSRFDGLAAEERAGRARALPPVSVLKPLCGKDAGLSANLESFFLQDHPNLELVFGVQSPNDPAIEVVRELAARYPASNVKLVVHTGGTAINPTARSSGCVRCTARRSCARPCRPKATRRAATPSSRPIRRSRSSSRRPTACRCSWPTGDPGPWPPCTPGGAVPPLVRPLQPSTRSRLQASREPRISSWPSGPRLARVVTRSGPRSAMASWRPATAPATSSGGSIPTEATGCASTSGRPTSTPSSSVACRPWPSTSPASVPPTTRTPSSRTDGKGRRPAGWPASSAPRPGRRRVRTPRRAEADQRSGRAVSIAAFASRSA